jgi:serine/threonine protein kinase
VVVKLLRPEFEPILPGRHRAGSRKLIRAVKRSDGWAPLLEAGTSTKGVEYIMQPYYPDGSLLDRLGRSSHWRRSLSLVGDAAAVVGQLGAQKLALGCLRPSYILVDNDTVVVSVFGMSTRLFDDGTIQYLAPEQQAGLDATPPSDVYTLGLILAESLAGRQRRPDESAKDLIASLPASIPTEVIDLLDHTMSSRVTNRIANAALLHRAIARLLVDLPDEAADPPVGMNDGAGSTPTVDDHDPTPNMTISAMTRLDEAEGGRGEPPPYGGPLDDLLESGTTRPATRHHRPTADARSSAELELEAMIKTLNELPSAPEGRAVTDYGDDRDGSGDEDRESSDDGSSGGLEVPPRRHNVEAPSGRAQSGRLPPRRTRTTVGATGEDGHHARPMAIDGTGDESSVASLNPPSQPFDTPRTRTRTNGRPGTES